MVVRRCSWCTLQFLIVAQYDDDATCFAHCIILIINNRFIYGCSDDWHWLLERVMNLFTSSLAMYNKCLQIQPWGQPFCILSVLWKAENCISKTQPSSTNISSFRVSSLIDALLCRYNQLCRTALSFHGGVATTVKCFFNCTGSGGGRKSWAHSMARLIMWSPISTKRRRSIGRRFSESCYYLHWTK